MIQTKSVFAAIVGRANVGKSSLLNTMIGERVSIVTPKPQTTRNRIMGVLTREETQFVFIDTPGFHASKSKLGDYMQKEIKESLSDVDVILMVIEVSGELRAAELELIESFKKRQMPVVLVINKIDTLKEMPLILARIEELKALYDFAAYIPVSAKVGTGVEELLTEVATYAKDGPHYFPDDAMTDQAERIIAAEMLREKALLFLQDEVPHGIGVVVDAMKENKNILNIEATIYCDKKSHKGIIIGKGGETLKKIASSARGRMETFFGTKVYLQVWVKVKEDWRNRESILNTLGYK